MSSYGDYYARSQFAPFVTERRRIGDAAIDLTAVRQPAGDVSDPVIDDLVIALARVRSSRVSCNFGEGPLRQTVVPGRVVVFRPGEPLHMIVDDPHEVAFMSMDIRLATGLLQKNSLADTGLEPQMGHFFQSALAVQIISSLWEEARKGPDSSRLFVEAAATALLAHLSTLARHASSADGHRQALPDWRIRRTTEMMAAHIDGKIGLAELASGVGLSPFHFCRAFKATLGVTPNQWLTQLRIARAQDLLRDPHRPIIDIALSLGYSSHSAFGSAFKRETGLTPKAWREAVVA